MKKTVFLVLGLLIATASGEDEKVTSPAEGLTKVNAAIDECDSDTVKAIAKAMSNDDEKTAKLILNEWAEVHELMIKVRDDLQKKIEHDLPKPKPKVRKGRR